MIVPTHTPSGPLQICHTHQLIKIFVLSSFVRMSFTWFLDVETYSNRSGCITSQGNSMQPGTIFMKTVLKNSLNRCAFSVGFLAHLPTLEYVTISGSLFVFDLIEWKDQNFFGLFFNLSAKDFKYLQYLEEMSFLVSLGAWNWRWALLRDYSSVSSIVLSFSWLTSSHPYQSKVVYLFVLASLLGCAF